MKSKKTIIVLAVFLIIAISYIAFDSFKDYMNMKERYREEQKQIELKSAYNQGIEDAQAGMVNAIIQQLQTQGYVTVNVPSEDGTIIPLQLALVPQDTTTKTSS